MPTETGVIPAPSTLRQKLEKIGDPNLIYLDRHETAEYLGLSIFTLENWVTLQKGPRFTKGGGTVRYRLSDVVAWLEANAK